MREYEPHPIQIVNSLTALSCDLIKRKCSLGADQVDKRTFYSTSVDLQAIPSEVDKEKRH